MSILDRIAGTIAATGIVRSQAQRRADRLAGALRTLASERGEASGAALARRCRSRPSPPGTSRASGARGSRPTPSRASTSATAPGSSASTGSRTRRPKGLAQSSGLMVNYAYELGHVERNHEDYVNRHQVAASSAVERMAKAVEALLG